MPPTGCIALLGDFSDEPVSLGLIGQEFCWFVCQTPDMRNLEALCRCSEVVAVLIHARTLVMPWEHALWAAQAAAPKARSVICHGFAETDSRPAMTAAGAFHTLLLPLNGSEVRQALGFIWAGKERDRDDNRTIVLQPTIADLASPAATFSEAKLADSGVDRRAPDHYFVEVGRSSPRWDDDLRRNGIRSRLRRNSRSGMGSLGRSARAGAG